jgi:[ribosomal protein S5]-alanine N-acetyltransferase
MNAKPFLIGKRIHLRPLQESDAEGHYLDWLNDHEVCGGNNHHRHPYLHENALSYIQYAQRAKDALILAIVTEDDIHIGNISLQDIDYIHRSAEFAILLGEKAYWNQGYAKEAAQLIIHHGFSELNLNRISSGTYHTNAGMLKLAESLGFFMEGRRRSAAYKHNDYVDIVEFGLLKQEWELHISSISERRV